MQCVEYVQKIILTYLNSISLSGGSFIILYDLHSFMNKLLSLVSEFIFGVFKAVWNVIPTTLLAIGIGAIAGGFSGLPFGPLSSLTAVGGAVLFGLPVAIWEYKIRSNDETAHDYID